jgi:hypothetical protein
MRALLRKTRTIPMFNILRRSAPRYPTIRQTLVSAAQLATTDSNPHTDLDAHQAQSTATSVTSS